MRQEHRNVLRELIAENGSQTGLVLRRLEERAVRLAGCEVVGVEGHMRVRGPRPPERLGEQCGRRKRVLEIAGPDALWQEAVRENAREHFDAALVELPRHKYL